ncbi:MAG: hypothetical protein OEU92_32020 [Alphaproteobacteria bacterium]|nr:hypothetical protein [Alphaproteobacteria bacterium]
MKFGVLKSIGHNVAYSLASGCGLLIGTYNMDVFGEAARSPNGYIHVDFLSGLVTEGPVSKGLAQALLLYREALQDLCKRHEVDISAFRAFTSRYLADPRDQRFIVTVEDQCGRRSVDEFSAHSGKRVMELDALGRLRPMKSHQ